MWKLETEKDGKRVYKNSKTGSQCTTTKVYTDKEGNDWFEFDNLTSIPYTRSFAATKISSLYALGLSKDDLTSHINGLKVILNSDDTEKYQKAYANVLDFESKANNATDPIKQMSALVPVYFTINDEPIDSFETNLQLTKMALLEGDINAHSFFLSRLRDTTENLMNFLNQTLQIASVPVPDLLAHLQ